MSKIFLIPGMGADTRIFNNIELPNDYEVIPIDWIAHHNTDTLEVYAQKLIYHYDITPNSIVIGNSMGGMIAVEIAKKVNVSKAILISSIKTINEAPGYFHFFKKIPLYKILPDQIFSSTGKIIKPLFGRMPEADLWLFNDMLRKNVPSFLRWAMGAVVNWHNLDIPPNVYQIHGDKDHILPGKNIMDATVLKGGSHVMIFDNARPINKWLKPLLKK